MDTTHAPVMIQMKSVNTFALLKVVILKTD